MVLDAEESRHLLHAHRAAKGAPFVAVDGAGNAYECVLDSIEGRAAAGTIVARHRDRGELPISIGLIAGLGDLASAEAVVELAVPLGVDAIDLAACFRSGRPALEPPRLERMARVARAAMKQARRCRLPAIRSSASLEGAVRVTRPGLKLFADPGGGALDTGRRITPEDIVIIAVGPPGGFDGAERDRLLALEFVPISLGPSRLRTELAAVTLVALVRNMFINNSLQDI